jgi:hypothetical protein
MMDQVLGHWLRVRAWLEARSHNLLKDWECRGHVCVRLSLERKQLRSQGWKSSPFKHISLCIPSYQKLSEEYKSVRTKLRNVQSLSVLSASNVISPYSQHNAESHAGHVEWPLFL